MDKQKILAKCVARRDKLKKYIRWTSIGSKGLSAALSVSVVLSGLSLPVFPIIGSSLFLSSLGIIGAKEFAKLEKRKAKYKTIVIEYTELSQLVQEAIMKHVDVYDELILRRWNKLCNEELPTFMDYSSDSISLNISPLNTSE